MPCPITSFTGRNTGCLDLKTAVSNACRHRSTYLLPDKTDEVGHRDRLANLLKAKASSVLLEFVFAAFTQPQDIFFANERRLHCCNSHF
jgi:hypothetical protein